MIPTMDTTTASCTLHWWFANKSTEKVKTVMTYLLTLLWSYGNKKLKKFDKHKKTNLCALMKSLLPLALGTSLASAWHPWGGHNFCTIFAQSRAQQMHPLFLRSSTTVFCQCPMHCFMEQVENVWPFCLFVEYQSLPSAVSPYLWYRFYNSVHWI